MGSKDGPINSRPSLRAAASRSLAGALMAMGFVGGGSVMKAVASKGLVVKINVAFLSFFVFAYVALLLLRPASLYDDAGNCGLRGGCLFMKKAEGGGGGGGLLKKGNRTAMETMAAPSFLKALGGGARVALVNMAEEEAEQWGIRRGAAIAVAFEPVSEHLEWKDLFPEWIDEEEENDGPSCPEIPLPALPPGEVDAVLALLPCGGRGGRDVRRLQVHLAAASVAARRGRRDGRGRVRVALRACGAAPPPMMEVFRCDEVVAREGEWWVYTASAARLEEKLALPVGSCNLAMPLWAKGTDVVYDASRLAAPASARRREAYVTVLHSSEAYVCGALMLAHSIRRTGSARELVLLHDRSIAGEKLQALAAAGWSLREIERIRNPRAERGTYNEYNYSKLRLWQLTEYHKLVFIDADILVLRNLDPLFHFPQISAAGNDGVIFNSGVMVIEPSNCTFRALMARRADVVSYNGGDQGFLNEVFVWWHRLPRRVNFLKNIWSNTTAEASVKNRLFAAEPPELYAIHYLGIKPWSCRREYDCNWNVGDQRSYASDAAHATWWRVHDAMDEVLRPFCHMTEARRAELEEERRWAEKMRLPDGHWRRNATATATAE